MQENEIPNTILLTFRKVKKYKAGVELTDVVQRTIHAEVTETIDETSQSLEVFITVKEVEVEQNILTS